jgi:hypothetical protein
VVEASAVLLDEELIDPLAARRRAIAAWSPGVTMHRLRAAGGALLVRFPAPRVVDCARAPGLPLVRLGEAGILASAPLDPDEIAAIAPPAGAVVIVRGGEPACVVPADGDLEDPARFLDVSAFALASVTPLGPPPDPPKIVGAPTIFKARPSLGVREAPEDLEDVVAAMRAWKRGEPAQVASAARPSFFASFLRAIATLITRLFGPKPARGSAGAPAVRAQEKRALVVVAQAPAGPSFLDRVTARLRDFAATILVHARLASFIGRRQAEYVDRMLTMFESGDIDEALRHAIPLSEEGEESAGPPAPPALGVPSARTALAISTGSGGSGGGAIYSPPDFYAELRRRYRAAFERLEAEGRIDEAAFVLAELLRDTGEAVAFLERHGRFHLAAELAEGRGLAPALVVRQWMLAGDVRRAVLLARRHGVFAEAIGRIGARREGVILRVLWAETLAEAGDFAAAVETAYPLKEARGLAAAWIDAAIAQGGVAAARVLARKLTLFPASFPEVRERALALSTEEGGTPAERRAFAEALLEGSATPASRTLARPLLRALVRDGALSGDPATLSLVTRVLSHAGDDLLRADIPAWPTVERTPLRFLRVQKLLEIARHDAGATPVHDAVHLPDGRTALALGEAGVRVLDREGRALFHLDEPAHHLVISDRGDRALALASRGSTVRIARLDLVGRRSESWCDARLDAFARDFDGAQWIVAAAGKLLVIDALDTRFDALASFDLGAGANRIAIGRSADMCGVIDGEGALRRYAVPGFTLRSSRRLDLARPTEERFAVSAHETGGAVRLARERPGMPGARVFLEHQTFASGTPRRADVETRDDASPIALAARFDWIACAVAVREGVVVRLFDELTLGRRYEIALLGATRASLRFLLDTLTVADDRGRVIVVELQHGGLVRDARV